MPRGVAFDELLDEKLAAEPIDSKPAVTVGPAGMATAYGFFFVDAPRTAAASSSAQYELSMGRRASAVSVSGQSEVDKRFVGAVNTAGVRVHLQVETAQATQRPAPVRPVRRHLSLREQRAFDALEALGGTLAADFTFDELRSVFRNLARRYHPDRHSGSSTLEKTRLAEQFTKARDAYQVLAEQFTSVN
jgi:hypothetical protein